MMAELRPATQPLVFFKVVDVQTWDGATDVIYECDGGHDVVVRADDSRVVVKER